MLTSEHILKIIEAYGDNVAQEDAETRRTITFDDIRIKSTALTNWLRKHNLGYGSIIGFMNQNNVDFVWILMGIWNSGAACHLIDPKFTLREVLDTLSIAPVDCLVIQKGGFERLSCPAIKKIQLVLEFGEEKTLCSQGTISMDKVLRSREKGSQENLKTEKSGKEVENGRKTSKNIPDDLALLMTSSGTTGAPKCVMITHQNVLAALSLSNHLVQKDARALGLMPYRHSYGLITMLMCLCQGAFIVNMASFSLSSWINNIREFSLTHLHIVPSLTMSLLKTDSINFHDLQSIEHIWLAATPISDEAHEKLLRKFHQPVVLHKAYGLTETTYITIFGGLDHAKPGCLGKVVKIMQCKIVDMKSHETLPPHSMGEVCFKGPMVTKGYMNDPRASSEAIDENGWVRSGDLGYLDEDGFFYYVDRMKCIIKYQGKQISPCELEAVLISYPEIEDAAVIGVLHEIFGEVPRAFIVRQAHSSVTAQEIHDYVRGMVAPYKRLRGGIVFLPLLPKIGPCKIDKSFLRAEKPNKIFYDQDKITLEKHVG